jgi:formate-dependent nitrite reductase cytochrome c552 subunit
MLKQAKVPCGSCHFDLIQASGGGEYEAYFEDGVLKTVLLLGGGRIKKEDCLGCHDQAGYLKKAGDKKMMHLKHVTTKNARCFDCHQPITHAKGDLKRPMTGACAACHPMPHFYQRMLAAGPEREEVPHLPDPMFRTRSNCLACHVEKELTDKGQIVMRASAGTCVQCHSKDYEKMLELWKRELVRDIKKTQEMEREALEVLARSMADQTGEKLAEAEEMLRKAQENLNIVKAGNGIHNVKYSIALLDAATTIFEDLIFYLKGEEKPGEVVEE